ncbi:hypothetical protein AX16_002868 [Volvariella volvacea WC 439]|nr:hypothetical protein AX16_002868 [Volvariella volvacea WC 439]
MAPTTQHSVTAQRNAHLQIEPQPSKLPLLSVVSDCNSVINSVAGTSATRSKRKGPRTWASIVDSEDEKTTAMAFEGPLGSPTHSFLSTPRQIAPPDAWCPAYGWGRSIDTPRYSKSDIGGCNLRDREKLTKAHQRLRRTKTVPEEEQKARDAGQPVAPSSRPFGSAEADFNQLSDSNSAGNAIHAPWERSLASWGGEQAAMYQSHPNSIEPIKSFNSKIEQNESRLMALETGLDDAQEQFSRFSYTTEQKFEDLQRQLTIMREQLDRIGPQSYEDQSEVSKVFGTVRRNIPLKKDLGGLIEALNEEVSHVSSVIVDSLDFNEPSRKRLSDVDHAHALSQLEGSLPPAFLSRLACHRPILEDVEPDSGVQIALQAIMTEFVCFYARSWCPSNVELSSWLQQIYEGICKSDLNTLAPHWRSITHAQIRQQTHAQDVRSVDEALRGQLVLLLNACGWSDDYILANDQHSDAIDRGIEVITETILHINKVIYEDMLHEEVKILWFEPGSKFLPDLASDDGIGGSCPDDGVLCTTQLGIQVTSGDSVSIMITAKVILGNADIPCQERQAIVNLQQGLIRRLRALDVTIPMNSTIETQMLRDELQLETRISAELQQKVRNLEQEWDTTRRSRLAQTAEKEIQDLQTKLASMKEQLEETQQLFFQNDIAEELDPDDLGHATNQPG